MSIDLGIPTVTSGTAGVPALPEGEKQTRKDFAL